MTNQLPEVFLPTRIELDEDVHPALRKSGAYIEMQELGQLQLQQLRDAINSEKSRTRQAETILKFLADFFIDGKLPDKNKKLFAIDKKYFQSGKIPMKIMNQVIGVLMGNVLPKKGSTASDN